jgi:hypothetical protein
MTDIFNQATQLDTAMASSRASVDKLVRVRRLLDRLEFLSELPEKLSRMIDSCMYKDAVQLYRKSITVLTKHSHVLSFKKIKERTESMMNDLRKKVIALLDDPSLEAIKMTYYVQVLRLMDAPTDIVVTTLLRAHRQRAKRLIDQFEARLLQSVLQDQAAVGQSKSQPPALAAPSSTVTTPLKQKKSSKAKNTTAAVVSVPTLQELLTWSREFHQLIIVGGIEACKALCELFPTATSTSCDSATSSLREKAVTEVQTMLQEILNEHTDLLTSVGAQLLSSWRAAHAATQNKTSSLMSSSFSSSDTGGYNKANEEIGDVHWKRLLQQLHSLQLHHLQQHPHKYQTHNDSTVPTETHQNSAHHHRDTAGKNDNATDSNALFFQLQEARVTWATLSRQVLNDVVYLDSQLRDCAAHMLHASTSQQQQHQPTCVSNVSLTKMCRDAWVSVLRQHYEIMREQLVRRFVRHIDDTWSHRLTLLLLHLSSSSNQASPYASLQEFQQPMHRFFWWNLEQLLEDTFQEVIAELKPWLEVVEVTQAHTAHHGQSHSHSADKQWKKRTARDDEGGGGGGGEVEDAGDEEDDEEEEVKMEEWPLRIVAEFVETLTAACVAVTDLSDASVRLRHTVLPPKQHHQRAHSHRHGKHHGREKSSHKAFSHAPEKKTHKSSDSAALTTHSNNHHNQHLRRAILEEEEDVFTTSWYSATTTSSCTPTSASFSDAWQVQASTALLLALLLKRLSTPSSSSSQSSYEHDVSSSSASSPMVILSPVLCHWFAALACHDYFPEMSAVSSLCSLHVQARFLKHIDSVHRLCYHHFLHRNVRHSQVAVQDTLLPLLYGAPASGSAANAANLRKEWLRWTQFIDQLASWVYLLIPGEALPFSTGSSVSQSNATGHLHHNSSVGPAGNAHAAGTSSNNPTGVGAGAAAMRRGSTMNTTGHNSSHHNLLANVNNPNTNANNSNANSSSGQSGGANRRVSVMVQRSLQLDIDRLFAAKVTIFPLALHVEKLSQTLFSGGPSNKYDGDDGPAANNNNSNSNSSGVVPMSVEVILGAVLKAAIKSGDETTRVCVLRTATQYTQLQMHAQFLRLLAPSILRDPHTNTPSNNSAGLGTVNSNNTQNSPVIPAYPGLSGGSTHGSSAANAGVMAGHHGVLLGELDQLLDQWLRTMFARYRGATEDFLLVTPSGGSSTGSGAAQSGGNPEQQVLQFIRREAVDLLRNMATVGVSQRADEQEDEAGEDEAVQSGDGAEVVLLPERYRTILIAR